jgi:hypothetical protein
MVGALEFLELPLAATPVGTLVGLFVRVPMIGMLHDGVSL